jgi:hypothetical protein
MKELDEIVLTRAIVRATYGIHLPKPVADEIKAFVRTCRMGEEKGAMYMRHLASMIREVREEAVKTESESD